VYHVTFGGSLIEAHAVYTLIPLIISSVIFTVIGWYMMKKDVKQYQSSTQNKFSDELLHQARAQFLHS